MSALNGYFQLAVVFGLLIIGFIGGWYVTKNAYEASETRSFAQAVSDYQKSQNKIGAIDAKQGIAQSGLANHTNGIKEKVNVEISKKHIVCVHTPAMQRLLHEASLPPTTISR